MTEQQEVLAMLESEANQTWLTKRRRAAALIRAQADEIERLRGLIAELLDTELQELACAGSHAPVEDILGRMQAALRPNAEVTWHQRPPQQDE